MPPDRNYVEASLAEIERTVAFLRTLAGLSEDEFLADPRNCFSACYALMTAIEGTANVASHLLTTSQRPVPRSVSEGFRDLAPLGVPIDSDFVERLSAMTRFRNLIVHRYWNVDYRRVYQTLQSSLDDFGLFARAVLSFLDSAC